MTNIENQFRDYVKALRVRMQEVESIDHVTLCFSANGRPDGEWEITFKIDSTYKSRENVESGNLEAIVNEYIRRHDWNASNKPLCLPNVEA